MTTQNEVILHAAQEGPEYGTPEDGPTRRGFVASLGAGLLISIHSDAEAQQQQRGGRGGRGAGGGFAGTGARTISSRVHFAESGAITVFTGKVEGGQGARAQLTQAAAEELRVPASAITLVMADTALVPDDGVTAGSRSTPSTVPSIRQGCAAARELLTQLAGKSWSLDPAQLDARDGKIIEKQSNRALTFAEITKLEGAADALKGAIPQNVTLTAVGEWKVLGSSVPRANARDLVTGKHQFPSDIARPGMLYGRILRAPSYGAKLKQVNASAAKAIKGVTVVQDAAIVGVVAPTTHDANAALAVLAANVEWESAPHPDSKTLYDHLRKNAQVPSNPHAEELAAAAKKLKQTYHVAYVQHAPMEPRAAVAEWTDGKLTVWTATQNPFGVRNELVRAFELQPDNVRVIVPDFGGGFGGKHSGECAVECARLAKSAGKPVKLRWTREEEFTWAYFRPAAVIDAEATLDAGGKLTSWHFININSGGAAVDTPYRAGKARSQFVASQAPLRHGSYRALASTANMFARESFMDELAHLAGQDPLEFRLNHLDNERIRNVLLAAADRFDWRNRIKQKQPGVGIGLACGTEKASFVAACVEVSIDKDNAIKVNRVVQAYECGKIINPGNLTAQVTGSIIMGLGPALGEEMIFENGKMLNATFRKYPAPRFDDVPPIDVVLLDRPDLPSVGGSETPIIAVAPAIANAVFHASGQRIRQMPMRLNGAKVQTTGASTQ